ncbi:hypothetical protein LTR94_027880, partial [Friedmanniomyces endolithicus]
RWAATPSRSWTAAGLPQADGNLARSAVVDASRQFETQLRGLLSEAGVEVSYPLILWRDRSGFLKACGCSDPRSWAFIRDDLNAPETIGPDLVDEAGPYVDEAPAPASAAPAPAPDSALPYPNLPSISPVSGAQPQGAPTSNPPTRVTPQPAPSAAARPTAPQQPQKARPQSQSSPRSAPVPKRQDDTTFY